MPYPGLHFSCPRCLLLTFRLPSVVPVNAEVSSVYGNVKACVETWWDAQPGTNPCRLWQMAELQESPAWLQQPRSPPTAITWALATEQLLKEGGLTGRRNRTPPGRGRQREGHETPLKATLLFGCLSLHQTAVSRGGSDVSSPTVVQAVNPEQ